MTLDWLLQREWWQILMMWCAIGYVLTMLLAYYEPDEQSRVDSRGGGEWAILVIFCSFVMPIMAFFIFPGKVIKYIETKGNQRKELKDLKAVKKQ